MLTEGVMVKSRFPVETAAAREDDTMDHQLSEEIFISVDSETLLCCYRGREIPNTDMCKSTNDLQGGRKGRFDFVQTALKSNSSYIGLKVTHVQNPPFRHWYISMSWKCSSSFSSGLG